MKKTLTLLALAVASMGSAMAAETPMYVGATAGYSHGSHLGIDLADHDGASGSVFGGYQITPKAAVELGYTRLSDVGDFGLKAKPEMVTVQGVGKTNVNAKTALFAKGGVAFTRTRGDLRENHLAPVVGVGAEYALNKNLSAQAEVQYVHDFAGTDARVLNTSVGLKYHF